MVAESATSPDQNDYSTVPKYSSTPLRTVLISEFSSRLTLTSNSACRFSTFATFRLKSPISVLPHSYTNAMNSSYMWHFSAKLFQLHLSSVLPALFKAMQIMISGRGGAN